MLRSYLYLFDKPNLNSMVSKIFLNHQITAVFILFITASISGQTVEQKAGEILNKYQAATVVLTIKSVVKASGSGVALPAREQQSRTLGVTVTDSGLIAASNSAIDASVGLVGQNVQVDGKVINVQSATTLFTSLEISYGNATTLTGTVVWKDVDADVVFIRPNKSEGKTFTKVDLNDFAVLPNVADRVVGLSRASSVFGYMPTLMLGRITGVQRGDRSYYLNTAGNSVGMPIFTIDGKPLGLTVNRVIQGKPTGILTTLSAGSINVFTGLAEKAK